MRRSQMQETIDALRRDVEAERGRNDALSLTLGKTQARVEALTAQLARAGETQAALEEKTRILEAENARIAQERQEEMAALEETLSALREENQALTRERDRREAFTEYGSIADAALALSGIFDAAQAAADRYVEEVRREADTRDYTALAQQEAEEIRQNARQEAEEIRQNARQEAEEIRQNARQEAEETRQAASAAQSEAAERIAAAEKIVGEKWSQFQENCREVLRHSDILRSFFPSDENKAGGKEGKE